MKLTGKYQAETNSSFVEFEVDELPSKEAQSEIVDEATCYEAIWMGEAHKAGNTFGDSPTLMIGMDDSEMSDLDLLLDVMSEEDVERIKEIKRTNY